MYIRGKLGFCGAQDGKRFLVASAGSQPLDVVVNWPALLKQGAAAE
jgi:hypothetical protein